MALETTTVNGTNAMGVLAEGNAQDHGVGRHGVTDLFTIALWILVGGANRIVTAAPGQLGGVCQRRMIPRR
jgi:hypothetical protein